jgi:NTP pyrophosphatase (non-canonical NTP hydrolase)
MDDLSTLQTRLREFARERDWKKFHSPKNLSMAIASEAGELLELFQWLSVPESMHIMDDPKKAAAVREEIADVFSQSHSTNSRQIRQFGCRLHRHRIQPASFSFHQPCREDRRYSRSALADHSDTWTAYLG